MGRGQGQGLPEFGRLQGQGVEHRGPVADGQALGQYLRVGAVQHQAQAAHLLHRLHHEGHAVLVPGRQETGVEVQNFGAGLLAAPGQFLQGAGVQVFQGRGHHGVQGVQIVSGNDQSRLPGPPTPPSPYYIGHRPFEKSDKRLAADP